MATTRDYYAILGVEENATATEVRRAYRRAARAHHPDLNPGDAAAAERFIDVQEAYEVLSDPTRRAAYRRPARAASREWTGGSYASAWDGPDESAARRRGTADGFVSPSGSDDLADAIIALRMLARHVELERRLRRVLRFLEGL